MLVFRKWFLALALVTLTVAVASAQPALQCVANAGVPPIVRSEGLTELTGDLVLNCTNGNPAGSALGPSTVPQVNVQIFLNTNITSRVDGDDHSEALLMIDEPVVADQQVCEATSSSGNTCQTASAVNAVNPYPDNLATALYEPGLVYKPHTVGEVNYRPTNIWQGRKGAENSIFWLGVPIDAPGTAFTRIIRITNVRANANQLGVSSTLVPNQIIAYISITGSTSIPINNPQQTVAWIQTGLSFSVRNLAGDSGSVTLQQCAGSTASAVDLFTDPNHTGAYCFNGRLRFQENFATAFKTRFAENGYLAPGLAQNNPGIIYNGSESGFFSNSSSWIWAGARPLGMADQGTRLRVQFNNIPAGVRMYVSVRNSGRSNAGIARLVNTGPDGSGGYAPIPDTGNVLGGSDCADWGSDLGTGTGREIAEIPIFGGTASAVWEVIQTDPLITGQRLEFGYVVSYKANTANNLPGLGSVTANGMYAPISTVTKMSTTAPIPRFADTSSALTVYKIEQCITNLLFPFVSNQSGFDTGMVISNTSMDPFGSSTESGTCKLNYYGNTNGGAAPPAQTSAAVPPGDHLIWGLSSGGTLGIAPTQGFQGYVIAQCKFRWAHGFAFISDYGNTKTAHGYLALIMDKASLNRTDITSESLGQ
jgi:hypothetical protein